MHFGGIPWRPSIHFSHSQPHLRRALGWAAGASCRSGRRSGRALPCAPCSRRRLHDQVRVMCVRQALGSMQSICPVNSLTHAHGQRDEGERLEEARHGRAEVGPVGMAWHVRCSIQSVNQSTNQSVCHCQSPYVRQRPRSFFLPTLTGPARRRTAGSRRRAVDGAPGAPGRQSPRRPPPAAWWC